MMIKYHRKARFRGMLKLNRRNLRVVIGMLTGHCCLLKYLKTFKKEDDDTCIACNREIEDMKHVLLDCSVIRHYRSECFENEYLNHGELEKVEMQT